MTSLTTCLWFDGAAEEAARFYTSLLPDSRIVSVNPGPTDWPAGKAGTVVSVEFTLAGQPYLALNGGPHFSFTPAISTMLICDDQAEVDRLWTLLSDGGAPMQCGWITDRYGVTWQVVPKGLEAMFKSPDKAAAARAFQAMMPMVKLDMPALEKAFRGEA